MMPIGSLAERVRFPEAFVAALIIHLLALFLVEPIRGFLPASPDLQMVPVQPEPLQFTFVNLPDEVRVEENPDARFFSDADRLARADKPPEETGDSDIPQSEGNSSMIEITPPEPQETFVEPSTEVAEPQPPQPDPPPAGGPEPAPPQEPETDGPVRQPPADIEASPENRTEKILEALRDVAESKPGGFDTRFESRQPSRIWEFGGLSFETKNFEWGDYARRLQEIIRSNWRIPLSAQMGEIGKCRFRFTIERDGQLSSIELVKSSGIPALDNAAQQALQASSPVPPLPARFPKERETVTCGFYYNLRIDR